MTEQEIEERILVCEKCERNYREVDNVKRADKFSNEKYKWEKLLSKLDPKRDEQLADYKKGYNILEQALNEIREYINGMEHLEDWISIDSYVKREKDILQIINKVLGKGK